MFSLELIEEYHRFGDKVTDLLKKNPENTFLHQAASRGYDDLVAFLLQRGFNPTLPYSNRNKSLPIHFVEDPEVLKVFIRMCPETIEAPDNQGWTVLHRAVKETKWDIVKFLLENGANPNQFIVGTRTTAWNIHNSRYVKYYMQKYMWDVYREDAKAYINEQKESEPADPDASDTWDVLDYLSSPSLENEFKYLDHYLT